MAIKPRHLEPLPDFSVPDHPALSLQRAGRDKGCSCGGTACARAELEPSQAFPTSPFRVQVRDREIKVNIFDMAGHPFFYEVRQTRLRAAHCRAALSQPISEAFGARQLSLALPEIGFGGWQT